MYFDTHAHYDDQAFDEDRNELLLKLKESGNVDFIINPGCDCKSSKTAQKLSDSFAHVYFAAGIHPENLSDYTPQCLAEIEHLATMPKCLAVGEIGLDYYWTRDNQELQITVFRAQCELAQRLDLPVIIHDRDAHGDCLQIVKEFNGLHGVFHCFSGSPEMAEELLSLGWYLGFDGPVTYKNARKAPEVIQLCPYDRMLIETDSPYLSPVPMRGKRNDSSNLCYIVDKIAQIKGATHEEIARITADNAKKLFKMN